MKTILRITVALLFLVQGVTAQRVVEKRTSLSADTELSLDFQFADQIKINGWDKNEVYVKATVNINDNKDNDKFFLEIDDHDWFLEIISEVEDMEKVFNQSGTIRSNDESDRFISKDHTIDIEMNFEVYLPREQSLELSTISGDIDIKECLGKMKIETISGFIDVTLPQDHSADIDLNTLTGGMYTDFDINTKDKRDIHGFVNHNLTASLNNGGKDIKLESVSGDLYLRKKK